MFRFTVTQFALSLMLASLVVQVSSTVCGIGENSTTGMAPCEPCPKDTYADEPGTILCIPCPEGTTTEGIDQNGTGAYDAWDCRVH